MTDTLLAERPPLADDAALPLFYTRPIPLLTAQHSAWRLLPGDHAFAADTNTVMLAASEFVAAGRCYPILFAGNNGLPVALLGLERHNLFVADGVWAEDAYIPAYVRRYPFIFYATDDSDRFVLGVDADSDRIAEGGDAGVALFDGQAASPTTTQALHFCEAFRRDCDATAIFAAAVQDLLVDQHAAVTLDTGQRFDIDGFKVVDRERFAALDDTTVLDWHRKGWLALIEVHLSSLDRFQALLDRQARATTATA